MSEPDFEALANMSCPNCGKRAGEHSSREHRVCAVAMLQTIGVIPDDVSPDQVEIITSDDVDGGSEEIMNMIRSGAGKGHKHDASCRANSENDLKELLQNMLDAKFPERPDSEDYWAMAQITANIDVKEVEIEDPEEFFAYLTRHCDKEAALYVGLTRANSALMEGLKSMNKTTHLLALLHAVWMDGFAVGQELHKVHEQ